MSLRKETENIFEMVLSGHLAGAVSLKVDASNAKVSVVTTGSRHRLFVRVFTRSKDHAHVFAVENAQVSIYDNELTVFVPPVAVTSSRNVINGGSIRGGVVFNSFGSQSIGGVDSSSGVEVEIDLPAPNITAKVSNGRLIVVGAVDLLNVQADNGSLRADQAHRVLAKVPNGNVKIQNVTGSMDVKADNGNVKIGRYNGRSGKVRASNGSIEIAVGPDAQGELTTSADNGSTTVSGTRANPNVSVNSKASNGHVKKS